MPNFINAIVYVSLTLLSLVVGANVITGKEPSTQVLTALSTLLGAVIAQAVLRNGVGSGADSKSKAEKDADKRESESK